MANQSGNVYGLTILSPIKKDRVDPISHSLAIRTHLQTLPVDGAGPFGRVPSTHMARLVVLDDVVYFGMPSCEEHLKSKYLIFESNFDGDLDAYLRDLATQAGDDVDKIWGHCIGYPGSKDVAAFARYMKRCQVETNFYFADVNDKTVEQTLKALQTQSAVTTFIQKNQGKRADELQLAFTKFLSDLRKAPAPMPGTTPGKELTDEPLHEQTGRN
jgi:hypothetical protein